MVAASKTMDLKDQCHPLLSPLDSLRLTPALFGKLLVLAWAERNGRSDLPDRRTIINELIQAADTAPDQVRTVMHVEDRVTGPSISEYTDYMVAAQDDGFVKRYNPAFVRSSVEVGAVEASNLLAAYEGDFLDVIVWLRDRITAMRS
jgi:hypothetical protein